MTREWVFPASFAQERVWLANQLDIDSPVYNVSCPVWLPEGTNVEQATAALATVVERHESLRTHLRFDGDALVQVVRGSEPVSLGTVDLRDLPPAQRDSRIDALSGELARQAIPMHTPPLWRACLVRTDDLGSVLLFVAHHAVFDGRSTVLLFLELTELCGAVVSGRPPQLEPLPIQYADFSSWQRDRFGGQALDAQLAFWRSHLSGAPSVMALPTDRPRPPRLGFAGDEIRFELPDGLHERVAGLGRRFSTTPYTVLLAAYAALLARLCATDDVVIGVSTSGRDRPEVAGLIGMFVNPVPLRIDASGDPSFGKLVLRARAGMLDVMEHWQTPFQCIVETVGQQWDPSAQPLFQVSLNYIPDSGIDDTALGTTKDDLAFDIAASTSRLLYRTALFDRATAEGLLDRFLRLLDAAVADPDRPIGELPLLSRSERATVLQAWNDTGRTPAPATLPALFEAQVRRTPDHTALIAGDMRLSYEELDRRANRLARILIERGAGPESLVGIALHVGADAVVALLAVLKSGAAYLPIDPDLPAARIELMVADAAPVLVIDDRTPIEDDTSDGPDADLTDADRRTPLRLDNAAYVLYTSGSTGRPKGVVVEHRSVHAYLEWARRRYPGLVGTALLASPLSFDLSVTALLGTLTAGGTIRLAATLDEPTSRAGGPPSFIKTTPSQLPLVEGDLAPTTDLVLGGEALAGEPLRAWRDDHPSVAVTNEYGPTEATVGCVAATFAPGDAVAPDHAVTIGRPAFGVRVYILDPQLRPVPPGAVGELFVVGDQVARGYLHRPGLTAERFLPDPFGPDPGRMYRTGDLARWRTDGTIDFLGRADDQVKIRGIRVELEEVRATLLARCDVDDAVVVLRDDDPAPERRGAEVNDPRLVAYVVGSASEAELRSGLACALPEVMVPEAVVMLEALPLSPNGKVDRPALPPPPTTRPADSPGFVAPRTEAEVLVAEVFAEILHLDKVGALDDFFALGGNSLRGMRAVAKIRAEVDLDLPMRQLFRRPVVADLALQIERLVEAEVDALSDTEVAALLDPPDEDPAP